MTADFVLTRRFVFKQRVARGASGEVLRAFDTERGVDVAVKRLHAHIVDAVSEERFAREARLLASVVSEHVVRYVAHGVDEEARPCLVVEWLDGEDLAARRRAHPLSPAEGLAVVREAALGLSALHAHGIVHRDLKPSNIFLVPGEGGRRVKLIDLGVAHVSAEETLSNDGIAIGTPFYMSPEQARGDETITPRSDLFSLGVLLFELLAGKRPFTGDAPLAVLAKILLQDPPRLRDALPSAPPELDALVARAMAKAPADRFASAEEMAEAIAEVARAPGVVAQAGAEHAPAGVDSAPFSGDRESGFILGDLEQRVVTAVFARLPVKDAADRARPAFVRITGEHGGVAHPLVGRRMVAVFGGARTTGDEVRRAARAAIAMAAEISGARLSISTGRALSGAAGLTGEVIERGAAELDRPHIESPQSPGLVSIDEPTARLLGEEFATLGERGARMLSGLRGAPGGWEQDPGSARAGGPTSTGRAERTLLGKTTPCVGRDREIAALLAIFDECVADTAARAALVFAPAGAGKSRVRYELIRKIAARGEPTLLLTGRGDVLAHGSPFGLIGPALRRHAGVLDGEPLEQKREKLLAVMGQRLPAAIRRERVELLGEIANVPFSAAGRASRDAILIGDMMRAAWEEWLDAECQAQPVVIVLEDLHWGDVPSIRLVDQALRNLRERPLFVLALGRPEVRDRFPDLWAEREVSEVRLGALSRKSSERLIRSALGDAAPAEVVELITAHAEGNAFFLEELVRAVAEGATEALPDTVLGVVQARLDALGADAKRLLKAASVFGETFWRGGVLALLGGGGRTAGLMGELVRLVAREVITRRSSSAFPGEDEYAFRNALVREASYAMLAEEDRSLAHRLAGAWLERAGEPDAARLAEHFDRGGEPQRAMGFYLRAAEQALRGNDFPAAIARAERVIERGADAATAGAARLIQAEAERWRGALVEAGRAASVAAELLDPDSAAWFHAVREAIAANGRLGHMDVVEAWARESSAKEPPALAAGAQIASLIPAAGHFIYAGWSDAAAELIARIEELASASSDLDAVVLARVHQLRAVRAAYGDDPETSVREHTASLEQFERGGDQRNACLTRANLGFMVSQLGDLERGEAELRQAYVGAERLGLGTVAPLALHNLGGILAYRGMLPEACAVEARAVEAFAKQGDPRLEGASRLYMSMILCAVGDLPGAEREARVVAEAKGSTGALLVGALASLSRALLRQGRAKEALAAAEEAMVKLEAIGAIEEFDMLARVALVEALDAVGDREAARARLSQAAARLNARAARLRDPALREKMCRRLPDHARVLELVEAWKDERGGAG